MSAARVSFSVRLPEFTRTTTFRWALVVSGAFALCILLMFGFVFWRAAAYMTDRVDRGITEEANLVVADPPDRRLDAIDDRLRQDPRRVKLEGLFGPDGRRIAGNLESPPRGLLADGPPQSVSAVRVDSLGRERQTVRAVARRMPTGNLLVVARNVDEVSEIAGIVTDALVLGLIPALALGLAAGAFLSLRAQTRIDEVNRKVQRIVAGDLRERLPTMGIDDPFDRLAASVNGMLDEIEALVQSIAGVGDDIAHDLRTPLTRVRVGLERARQNAHTLDDLRTAVDQAIVGLDQSLALVTALLRIAEIEQSRRLAGFSDVALADVVREVGDLYEPIADLVDNAVKFTPQGGRIELAVVGSGSESVVRVGDNGPGISVAEHDLVLRRFYRSDKSRGSPGLGLGLCLVTAIVKLHGFRLTIRPGPGFVAETACQRAYA